MMIAKIALSFPINIFIAGSYHAAEKCCRDYCDDVGFCVTVTPTNYIYRGGSEQGVIVGLINYPRFPMTAEELFVYAEQLGCRLLVELGQQSFSIQTPENTVWYSERPEDQQGAETGI